MKGARDVFSSSTTKRRGNTKTEKRWRRRTKGKNNWAIQGCLKNQGAKIERKNEKKENELEPAAECKEAQKSLEERTKRKERDRR